MPTPQPQPPPAPGSYTYVLRRIPDWDPWLTETVSGYDEAVESLDIVHPDGKRSRTVFINSPSFLQRLLCDGAWENVTDMWSKPAEAPKRAQQRSLRVAG